MPGETSVADNCAGKLARSVRLDVNAEIRAAMARDMPALATWSGQVDTVFRPSLERDDSELFVALANGGFPIGHVLVDLAGAVISHLLVLRGFREQGLGTGLLGEAEERLRSAGAGHVSLLVEKTNEAAIRLYERLDYAKVGETSETWPEPMPDGTMRPVEHPSWVMRKTL